MDASNMGVIVCTDITTMIGLTKSQAALCHHLAPTNQNNIGDQIAPRKALVGLSFKQLLQLQWSFKNTGKLQVSVFLFFNTNCILHGS